MQSEEFKVISSYTRQQALEDGVLIDVTEHAKQSGFKVPVAVTSHLYYKHLVPPDDLEGQGQSLEGRMHDLFMMTQAAAMDSWTHNRVLFDVLFLSTRRTLEKVQCLAVAGLGDDGNICMTIMLPEDE